MPVIEIHDAAIHVEWDGPRGAPVLAFSNSLGTNVRMWSPQVVELSGRYRVLRYDTRGHGNSSVTPGPYSIEQLARDFVEMLDVLGVDRVCFCGLSMGGMIGMHLGRNYPQRLSKLILSNTAAKIGTLESWNTRIETVRKGGMKAIATGVIERWFTPEFRASHPQQAAGMTHLLESANPEGYVAACAAVRDMDQRNALASIEVPTLVIAGTHDPVTPPSEARFLVENIPGARYVELLAAHLSNYEAADAFNAEVTKFLLS